MRIPELAELLVFVTLFDENGLGMLLDKTVEDACSPLLCVEVVELWCALGLWLADVVVVLWVLQTHYQGDQIHPVDHQLLHLVVNLIMSRLPQELHNQVNKFRISIPLPEQIQIRQHLCNELKEVTPLLLRNGELKRCSNRNEYM